MVDSNSLLFVANPKVELKVEGELGPGLGLEFEVGLEFGLESSIGLAQDGFSDDEEPEKTERGTGASAEAFHHCRYQYTKQKTTKM